jgi:hypothetical protein
MIQQKQNPPQIQIHLEFIFMDRIIAESKVIRAINHIINAVANPNESVKR